MFMQSTFEFKNKVNYSPKWTYVGAYITNTINYYHLNHVKSMHFKLPALLGSGCSRIQD